MYTCTCTYTWTANLCYLLNTHILHVIHLKREHVLLIVPIFLPFNPLPSLSSWIWFVVVLTVFGWVLIVPVYIWCPTCTSLRDAVRILVVSVRDILLGDYFRGFRLFFFFFGVSYTDKWGYVYFAALKCLAGDYDKGSAWLMWFCVGDEDHCNGSSPLLPWPHVTWPCSESWNQGPDANSWLPDYFKSPRPSACNYKPSVIG